MIYTAYSGKYFPNGKKFEMQIPANNSDVNILPPNGWIQTFTIKTQRHGTDLCHIWCPTCGGAQATYAIAITSSGGNYTCTINCTSYVGEEGCPFQQQTNTIPIPSNS